MTKTSKLRGLGLLALAGGASACGVTGSGGDATEAKSTAVAALSGARYAITEDDLITPKGQRFVRISDDLFARLRADERLVADYSDQPDVVRQLVAEATARDLKHKDPAAMDDFELALMMRAVAEYDGRLYMAVDLPSQGVQDARALASSRATLLGSPGYNPSGTTDVLYPKAACCGTDLRYAQDNNTAWPYATIMATMVPVNYQLSTWGANVQSGSAPGNSSGTPPPSRSHIVSGRKGAATCQRCDGVLRQMRPTITTTRFLPATRLSTGNT